ncbi:hypothetical protein HRG_013802 [Hirsutella rhossiliensis]
MHQLDYVPAGKELYHGLWMQHKCYNVRIPHLFGFGFLDGHHARACMYQVIIILIKARVKAVTLNTTWPK